MNSKYIPMVCAAVLCSSVYAQEEKIEEKSIESKIKEYVSFEASLMFDSKFMSYGLVDNKDSIITPSATATFFDIFSLGVSAIFDTTKYGKKAGYSNRGGRYTELDPAANICYDFSPEDFSWLPTTFSFCLGYMYEYHPRSMGEAGEDTQFVTLEMNLPDVFLEPCFLYERDIDRDDGTYLNLELGHTFAIIDAKEEGTDPILDFRLSVAQGFGNAQRVKGYLTKLDGEALDHAGLMDTCFKGEITYRMCEMFSVSGYVAYYDYLLDQETRSASNVYEATGKDDHNNFVCGVALTASF